MPVISACKELIVLGLGVADVCSHSQVDGVGIESLGCGGSTDARTVLSTSVLSDGSLSSNGARRVAPPYFHGEQLDIGLIGVEFLFGASFSASSACRSVLEAGGFSGFECWLFYEEALALVSLARTAPFQDDGPERGGLLGAPGERSIAGGEKFEVVEIRAGQTQCALGLVQMDPRGLTERAATLGARAIPVGDEDLDFRRSRHSARRSTVERVINET